jgi:hypothetical protein
MPDSSRIVGSCFEGYQEEWFREKKARLQKLFAQRSKRGSH